jgi:hypothetical protein
MAGSRVLRPGKEPLLAIQEARREARDQISQARFGQQLMLAVDEIAPNPRNPRRAFDEDAINQLAESLKSDGQIQPVVVRRVGRSWQLIAGERGWRAARRAGIPSVAAVIREASDQQAFRLAFVENLHRVGLSHGEMVDALDELADMAHTAGLRRTATELSMDPGWLSKQLSMRRDPVIFPALEDGRLTFTQANELLGAPAAARRSLLDRLQRERPPFDVLRSWVQATREEYRRSQQRIADQASGVDDITSVRGVNRFAELRDELKRLGDPRTQVERDTLGEMIEIIRGLLAERPNPADAYAPHEVAV